MDTMEKFNFNNILIKKHNQEKIDLRTLYGPIHHSAVMLKQI